jgi:hypothetical protein
LSCPYAIIVAINISIISTPLSQKQNSKEIQKNRELPKNDVKLLKKKQEVNFFQTMNFQKCKDL